ncbi:MAG: hypothetical protein LBN36_08940 [Clostridiales Family XIII bacterium]|jgi:hypothetical protein|nr:hypothetical protein [Clostridiales Family XIII bacterium]
MQSVKNRGKNRIISILTVAMLLMCLFPAAAFADDKATITVGNPIVAAPAEGYEPGATFRVPVTLADNPGFATVGFDLRYDTDALEVTGFDTSAGTLLNDANLIQPNPAIGAITGMYILANKLGDGILFYADFKVKDDAVGDAYEIGIGRISEAPLNFASLSGTAIPTDFVPTTITVKGEAPPATDPAQISLGSIAATESGEEFTVSATIADNPGFIGASFTLGYDTTALEIVSVTADGGLFASGLIWGSAAPGSVTFLNDGLTANITDNGKLFDVTFKVKTDATPGSYPITIGLKDGTANNFANWEAETVGVEFTGTSVTVSAPVPPAQVTLGSAPATDLGAEFTVSATVADNPGFTGASFTLGYDTTALEIVSVTADGGLFAGGLVWNAATNTVTFLNAEGLTDVTGDGKLFDVTFKVKTDATPGSYPITIGLKDGNANYFVNWEAKTVGVEFTGTSVTVKPPLPTGLKFVIGDLDGYLGQDIVVPVNLVDNPGFAAVAFTVDFDEDIFELKDADFTVSGFTDVTFVGSFTADGSGSDLGLPDGSYVITLVKLNGTDANIDGDGLLFNLVFKVKAGADPGSAEIKLIQQGPVSGWVGTTPVTGIPATIVPGTVEVLDLIIPTAADFSFTPTAATYNGSQHAVTVTATNDNVGAVTAVYYTGTGDTTYSKSAAAPIDAGTYTVSVDVAVAAIYGPFEGLELGTFTINKAAAPPITYPTASEITYGQALSAVVLSPASNDYGSFAFDSSIDLTATPDAGTYSYPVVFNTNDATLKNYEAITPLVQDVSVTVKKALAPLITWPTASAITYGQALSAVTLSGGSTAYGSFDWASSVVLTTVPNAGPHDYPVVFTPSAATVKNYETITTLTEDVTVTVNKAPAPSITWPTAGTIKEGKALSTSALTGGSTALGSFSWTSGTTVPPLAGGSYSVTFTPNADTINNYLPITSNTSNVSVAVRKAGDMDGDGYVTSYDVLLQLQYVYGYLPPPTGLEFLIADMDDDGTITVFDTLLILRRAAGLPLI